MPRFRLVSYRPVLLGIGLALAACDGREGAVPAMATGTSEQAAPAAPASAPTETKPPPSPDGLAASRDPHRVVLAWAKAMSLKDWEAAYSFWNEGGSRAGMSLDQFRTRWSKIENPQFDIAEGTTEGAAGSLYYTAPITFIDGTRRVQGEIVLRRANDVPGATAEQLRWHIERLDLQP